MIQMFKGISGWLDREPARALDGNPHLNRALGAIGLMVVVCAVLVFSAITSRVSAGHRPPPAVFVLQSGKAEHVQTVSDPSLSPVKLQRWVTRSTREIFSFNFTNYNEHVAQAEVFFTDLGYAAFQQGLINSKIGDRVQSSQLDVFLVPSATARIVDIKQFKGTVVFRTQMPALMVYKSASNAEIKKVMVVTSVRQVPTTENPDGIGISDIVLRVAQ